MKTMISNAKIINALVSVTPQFVEDKINGRPIHILTSSPDKDKNSVIISASYIHDMPEIEMTEKLSGHDKAVMDAVYTLWLRRPDQEKAQCEITYIDIYRVIRGEDVEKVRDTVIIKIAQSIKRLCGIDIVIKADRDSLRVRNSLMALGFDRCVLCSRALSAEERDIRLNNGRVTRGILLYQCPILCMYAEAAKQCVPVEVKVLCIPTMNCTEKMISLRNYLVTYIDAAKYNRDLAETITYRTILQHAGYDERKTRKAQHDDRATIKKILDHFVEVGLINGYEESTDKSKIILDVGRANGKNSNN